MIVDPVLFMQLYFVGQDKKDTSKSINNQVILTTTLKHEELGKYDSIEGVNHINYISHIPSKILDGRYVADFLGLLSALSIKVQS